MGGAAAGENGLSGDERMTDFLIRFFIRDSDRIKDPSVRKQYGMLSGTVGIILNLSLACGKFIAGTAVASISVTADAFNNLSDAASSFVTLFGFRMAGAPGDKDHPFGHGRMEYLAGLIISLLVMLAGIELFQTSVGRIIQPVLVEFKPLVGIVLAASVCIKLWMYLFNRRLAVKIGSTAMRATSRDSLSDCAATSVVLVGMFLGSRYGLRLDGYLGAVVACFIFYTGFSSAKETLSPILGEVPDPELVDEVTKIVLSHREIVGIHDLIIHNYGPGRIMISLHAEVPRDANLLSMHEVVDLAERELRKRFDCDAVIHLDPIVTRDEAVLELRQEVVSLVEQINPVFTIHDFRVVRRSDQTNLIFDVIVPYSCPLADRQIKEKIQAAVKALGSEYAAVVRIDKADI